MSWLCNLLGCESEKPSTPAKPPVVTPIKPPVAPKDPVSFVRIGIVKGHNARAQGATNIKGESEFSFHSRTVPQIVQGLVDRGYNAFEYERPATGGYSAECTYIANKLASDEIDIAYLMHFNSFNGSTNGIENLVMKGCSKRSVLMAQQLSMTLDDVYHYGLRGPKGVKTKNPGDRGSGMMTAVSNKKIDYALVEHCFGDSPSSATLFNDEALFVETMIKGIIAGIEA